MSTVTAALLAMKLAQVGSHGWRLVAISFGIDVVLRVAVAYIEVALERS